MKREFTLSKLLALIAMAITIVGCSQDQFDEIEKPAESGKYTCKMVFEGGISKFDGVNTRAEATQWSNGDSVYLALYKGDIIIPAVASYDVTDGWSVNYDAEIEEGEDLKLDAFYFSDFEEAHTYLVDLNPQSGIYEDLDGTYAYKDNTLTVYASLTPKSGRIRFSGTSGETIKIFGFDTYCAFSTTNIQFTTTKEVLTTVVAEDGYTPYIYGDFTYEDRSFSVVGDDYAYTRVCDEKVLAVGKSGYMAIPTEDNHGSWRNGLIVKAGENELKMLPVVGHEDGFFLMAETETTEGFYDAIEDTTSTSTSSFPKTNISWNSAPNFAEKVQERFSLNFLIPSSEQWEYAARGGNKSQGYSYAGSDIENDVAWYVDNSDGVKHEVKLKMPNELGLYDMSGNVWEWTSYHSYINYGSYYGCSGGSYSTSASSNASTTTSYNSQGDIGFRLILTFDK